MQIALDWKKVKKYWESWHQDGKSIVMSLNQWHFCKSILVFSIGRCSLFMWKRTVKEEGNCSQCNTTDPYGQDETAIGYLYIECLHSIINRITQQAYRIDLKAFQIPNANFCQPIASGDLLSILVKCGEVEIIFLVMSPKSNMTSKTYFAAVIMLCRYNKHSVKVNKASCEEGGSYRSAYMETHRAYG